MPWAAEDGATDMKVWGIGKGSRGAGVWAVAEAPCVSMCPQGRPQVAKVLDRESQHFRMAIPGMPEPWQSATKVCVLPGCCLRTVPSSVPSSESW